MTKANSGIKENVMGNRANIVCTSGLDRICFYSHWDGGDGMARKLRDALNSPEGRGRYSDDAYLNRIVFDRIVGSQQGKETGYGISGRLCDNEYDLIHLSHDKQTVSLVKESDFETMKARPNSEHSFESFARLTDEQIEAMFAR